MDWFKFSNHGESNNHAFEVMCNLLFEKWCHEEYKGRIAQFSFVNGAGGDGGVEALCILDSGEIIGVQSKWFPDKIEGSQINQIENSFETAMKIRPGIVKYIVCVPRDLGSTKMGRGGVPVRNTEVDSWILFVKGEKASFTNTEIILWDETRIQERLLQPNTIGIYKYWFENTIIFDEQIKTSYTKAVNSWAKGKYIPEVYSFGEIHNKLEFFLGSVSLAERRHKDVVEFINRLETLKRSFSDLLKLGIPDNEKDLQEKIENDLEIIVSHIDVLNRVDQSIKYGTSIIFESTNIGLKCTSTDFKESTLHYGKYFHFNETEKLLDNIEDDFYSLQWLLNETTDNRLIFIGNQGTGKTAGIVAATSKMFEENSHLPILVHAKDYSEGDTWLDVLTKTIGLSNTWDEKSLFSALQTSAMLHNIAEGDFSIESKCVICVDGLDEANSWQYWKDKIDEVVAYKEDFPRIKFVFLSRPYVFDKVYELDYPERVTRIQPDGDVPVDSICDKYFSTYKINIEKNTWIRKLLRTPDSVRLFCDIYRGETIEYLPQNTLVITNLYKKKIEELDKKFCVKRERLVHAGFLKTALFEIADLFLNSESLTYSTIVGKVSEQVKSFLGEVLSYLNEEGFLYTYTKQEDEFSTPQTLYSWGSQPALDYLIARKLYSKLESGEEISIEYTNGIYQMLALVTIEDEHLLFEYKNVIIDENEMFNLVCYALSNCSVSIASNYRDYVKHLLFISPAEFREVVNQIVLPVSGIENHPLGAELLDEVLRKFDTPAKRDIWWSIPAYLRDNYYASWRVYTEVEFGKIHLKSSDKYNTNPLVLAWSLTSVDNELRQESRRKLVDWGIKNSIEFWKLFCATYNSSDIQMVEDIFAIAYGLALDQFISDEYLVNASKWMIDNVFSKDGLAIFVDVSLRYYALGIVKIAVSKGLCDEKVLEEVSPPYHNYRVPFLPLYKEALEAERMGGFSAIDYDLARYVLCDRLDHFFWKNSSDRNYDVRTQKFIDKYVTYYDINKFSMDGFIIACVYQFLLDQGWTEEEFWNYEDKENYGVDVVIHRTHYPATHGAMSRIMTVAEKNVWLAKHKIEAVLSDEVPYCADFRTCEYINDYSQLENYINPYQDYANHNNRDGYIEWFNMELLANPCFDEMIPEKISEWIQEDYLPDFEKWFNPVDDKIVLSTFTNVQNNLSGVEEAIWISSGVCAADSFSRFLELLDTYFESRSDLANVDGFHAYQDCRCYCTPQEACLVHADREVESKLLIDDNGTEIELYKLAGECISADELETERYFTIPTVLTRSLTGIVYGDGFSYSNKNGEVLAQFYETGEHWGTIQKALRVNSSVLFAGIEQKSYKLFWIFRDLREPSNKARERFESMMDRSDKTFVVWIEEDGYKYKELKEIKPTTRAVESNLDMTDTLKSILGQYIGLSKDISDEQFDMNNVNDIEDDCIYE